MQCYTSLILNLHFLFLTDGGLRVGRDYQAQVPPLIPSSGNYFRIFSINLSMEITYLQNSTDRKMDQYAERALLVWSPTNDILDAKCRFFP